ncbi:hypothetical protein PTKIN_Ptkin09bG0010600 [Pterospermum kingtungense]
MMMPTLGLAQAQGDTGYGKVIVQGTNQSGLIKEYFGAGHMVAQAAAYTSSDWNNASTLGMVQVRDNMVLPTVSDILPGMDLGMASSTLVPYMQFYRPSDAEAKSPFIGQNQSYCLVNEQNAGHIPQLPSEESQADYNNLMKSAIQRRVLLAYIQHKKSGMFIGDAQLSFVNHMHSTVCHKYTCKCEIFFSLASHYDGCHDADCDICSRVCYSPVTSKVHPTLEHVKRGLSRDSDDGYSGYPRFGSSETMRPSFKRLKVVHPSSSSLPYNGICDGMAPLKFQPCDTKLPPLLQLPESPVVENPSSPSLPYNGMCYGMAPLKFQPCDTKLPPLLQLPESPASSNSEVMEANIKFLTNLIEDSTSSKDISKDVADNSLLSTESFPGPSEVAVCNYNLEENDDAGSHKEEDIDFRNGADVADVVAESNNLELMAVCHYNLEEKDATDSHKEVDMDIRNGTDIADAVAESNNLDFNTLSGFSGGLGTSCGEAETKAWTDPNHAEVVIENELIPQESNCRTEMQLESQKISGVSLTENFTSQQIKEHISSLQCIDKDMPKKEGENRIINVDSESLCQLCGGDKLLFAPSPIHCSLCGGRIRRSAIYYSTPEENDIRHCFCTLCYKASRGESITFSGLALAKEKLVKKKKDEETEESWVQCDKCAGWQHQICALFNDKKNINGKAQFICPKCCLNEIQNGERIPPLESTVFGAKDLPRTMLSDHIEQRLFRRLQKEREEKARVTVKSIDEVPEAEGLVVRVVSSVDKLVKVKKQLLDILHNENYPAEFPYKSKVILLFQKIDGVDVCLFSMYFQEYGSECGLPNQRCVYISYLDSVKYFRPDTKTAAGEALRSVVYHEILIGYLEYCKKRGFATCYLWACPPMKGEDYILYCHPETQKTPKTDKLRHWYQSMLQKAAKEKIVVGLTNLYDHFFIPTGKYNSKVTAAHLPYFDGDYWSGAAEDVIKNIEKASSENSEKMRKKIVSKRMLKAMGHTNPSALAIKDILLMQKLGQNILPIKEDFIIAQLHFVCTCCHSAILSGSRWFCTLCKSFQLCERCHDAEQNIYKECSHTLCHGEDHSLQRIMVDDSSDTDDKDVSVDNSLFENRHSFLSFCQRNNYQFDTLRRAKHSSMMVLHYLHNPSALTAGSTCTNCYKDIQKDQCWLCEICPNVAVCATCYQRDHFSAHIHKLTQHSSAVNSVIENTEAPMKESLKTQLVEVLLHACRCHSRCSNPNCLLIKKLFYHGKDCTVRVANGCQRCKKIWFILRLHSRNCKDSDCGVPRCRDLKQHAEFLGKQSKTFGRG